MDPISSDRLRGGSDPWRVFSGKLGLASPDDAKSVALVSAGLGKGLDLSGWVAGNESSQRWLDGIGTAQGAAYANLVGVLDSWSQSIRESVLVFCKRNLHRLPSLFAELRLSEEQDKASKVRGAVYTPSWLAQRVSRNALAHWRRLHRSGKPPRVIADVSCGVGVFLTQARQTFGDQPSIVGVDNDPSAVAYCQLLRDGLNEGWDVFCADTLLTATQQLPLLFEEVAAQDEAGIDILLGNPPYVRSQLLDPDYAKQLRLLYPAFTKGNFDLVVVFLEHALRALAPGGLASYIVSSKFMTSTYGKEICQRLASDARIINVEDFSDAQFFPGRTTYICVLTFAKLPPAKRFTVTRFPAGVVPREDPGKGQSYTLPLERLQTHPWDFTSGPEQEALRKLRASRHPLLSQVFNGIMQGMRTGANQVFVIPAAESSALESDLLIPFVTGEDIRRMRCNSERLELLFPYRYNSFGEPVLLSEEELRRYPKTWAYLVSKRQILVERALDRGVPWYAFGRTQNLALPRIRKLLVREMMPRAEFAADFGAEVGFCSGYALIAEGMPTDDLLVWTAVLNTPTMEFVLRHNGTQLHSGWFRLLKHHLKRTRLPRFSMAQRARAQEFAVELSEDPDSAETWQHLDEVVAEAFGLSERERQCISKYLEDCHERSLTDAVRAASVTLDNTPGETDLVRGSDPYEPVKLERYDGLHRDRPDLRMAVTFKPNKALPIHRWYTFTQGFSEPLVVTLLREFNVQPPQVVLDPFAGVGTTNVVCRRLLIPSIGIEISPFMTWLSRVKTRKWCVDELVEIVERVETAELLPSRPEAHLFEHYFAKAYSTVILDQLFGIIEFAESTRMTPTQREFLLVGLVGIMEEVSQIRKHGSHYRYLTASENIGLQKLNIQIMAPDAEVRPVYVERLRSMLDDVTAHPMPDQSVRCDIIRGDSKSIPLRDESVDFVITSPPYLNRNNYIAQQKAEMAILGLLESFEEYRGLVRSTIRSHVEGRFGKEPETQLDEVRQIVERITLTPNNNPKIPHMIAGYFEDLTKVIEQLGRVVSPGGLSAFVVGNSRWGGVVVPVDHLILMIAERYGFVPHRVLVTRVKGNSPQQMRRYGRIPVRESVVIFRKPA